MEDFRLSGILHKLECPHCQELTQHSAPGRTIPFAKTTCQHCGREFLIVQTKPWPENDRGGAKTNSTKTTGTKITGANL